MLNLGIHPGIGAPVIKQALPPAGPGVIRPAPYVSEPEAPVEPAEAAQPAEDHSIKWWSKDSFSFKDIIDMLNPLQHLPIISTLYRKLTGEHIGGLARIIGGAIYGRAGGFASMGSSILNAIFGAVTGKDVGERVYAALFGDSTGSGDRTAVAGKASPRGKLLSAAFDGAGPLAYRGSPVPLDPIASAAGAGGKTGFAGGDFARAAAALDSYERMAAAHAESRFGSRSRFED